MMQQHEGAEQQPPRRALLPERLRSRRTTKRQHAAPGRRASLHSSTENCPPAGEEKQQAPWRPAGSANSSRSSAEFRRLRECAANSAVGGGAAVQGVMGPLQAGTRRLFKQHQHQQKQQPLQQQQQPVQQQQPRQQQQTPPPPPPLCAVPRYHQTSGASTSSGRDSSRPVLRPLGVGSTSAASGSSSSSSAGHGLRVKLGPSPLPRQPQPHAQQLTPESCGSCIGVLRCAARQERQADEAAAATPQHPAMVVEQQPTGATTGAAGLQFSTPPHAPAGVHDQSLLQLTPGGRRGPVPAHRSPAAEAVGSGAGAAPAGEAAASPPGSPPGASSMLLGSVASGCGTGCRSTAAAAAAPSQPDEQQEELAAELEQPPQQQQQLARRPHTLTPWMSPPPEAPAPPAAACDDGDQGNGLPVLQARPPSPLPPCTPFVLDPQQLEQQQQEEEQPLPRSQQPPVPLSPAAPAPAPAPAQPAEAADAAAAVMHDDGVGAGSSYRELLQATHKLAANSAEASRRMQRLLTTGAPAAAASPPRQLQRATSTSLVVRSVAGPCVRQCSRLAVSCAGAGGGLCSPAELTFLSPLHAARQRLSPLASSQPPRASPLRGLASLRQPVITAAPAAAAAAGAEGAAEPQQNSLAPVDLFGSFVEAACRPARVEPAAGDTCQAAAADSSTQRRAAASPTPPPPAQQQQLCDSDDESGSSLGAAAGTPSDRAWVVHRNTMAAEGAASAGGGSPPGWAPLAAALGRNSSPVVLREHVPLDDACLGSQGGSGGAQ